MKDFKDLQFSSHFAGTGQQSQLFFKNGYGVSVVFGSLFYSNGVDTYEIAVTKGNKKEWNLCYTTHVTDDVIGYQTKEEISEIMKKVQEL